MLYAQLLINFPAGQVGGFIGSILLAHRWETMCFIPLHCKSNLMLHALQRSSRKRRMNEMAWGNVDTNPTIPTATPLGHRGTVERFWAINQSIKGLIGPHVAIMVIHVLLKWEVCARLDKAPKSGCLFVTLPIPTKRSHLGNQCPSWGKAFKHTIKE